MQEAFSALHVKDVRQDSEYVYITGVASTPTTDRVGDSVNPMGAIFETPMPILMQHAHGAVVGEVTAANLKKSGIAFEGRLPIIREPGKLKDRVDEAIHSLKYKLLNFVSIGFSAIEDHTKRIEGGGFRFDKWNWMELSLVTIPANPEAVISSVKSLRDDRPLDQEVIEAIKSCDIVQAQECTAPGVADPAPARAGPKKRGPVSIKKTRIHKPILIIRRNWK